MATSTTVPPATGSPEVPKKPRFNPVYLILVCTLFAASAQVLLKFGASHPLPPVQLSDLSSVISFAKALMGDWPLIIGYTLHGCNAMLLILALRYGHLSLLYPLYALSYIWVNLLSLYFFHEDMNGWKVAGIALIMAGVAVLGKVTKE